jgi:ubiquitin-protein ligase
LVGVTAAPLDDSIFKWHANIRGPADTIYAGGVFHMQIDFPENYPVSPPSITLFTKVPHPNVFGSTLCLDMLQEGAKKWYEGWTSAYTV